MTRPPYPTPDQEGSDPHPAPPADGPRGAAVPELPAGLDWCSDLELRRLWPANCGALLLHLLRLSPEDRYARFGVTLNDAALGYWIERQDWRCHRWWGVWDDADACLHGALQLSPVGEPGDWELALSIAEPLRRRGLGTALLAQAVHDTPDATRLFCHQGHTALAAMARRLGWATRKDRALALELLPGTAAGS